MTIPLVYFCVAGYGIALAKGSEMLGSARRRKWCHRRLRLFSPSKIELETSNVENSGRMAYRAESLDSVARPRTIADLYL